MAAEQSGGPHHFCLNEFANSSLARFGRALGRLANLCRAPTHSTEQHMAPEPQATSMYPGSVDTIPEDEVADVSHSGKADIEQGLSHSSSSSELMTVPNPYADAVKLPSRASIDAAAAARKLSHSTSTASSADTSTSTDTASAIQNYMSTHYNVGDDIVLRLEFIKEKQFKAALVAVWCVEALAFVALIVGISLKATKSTRWFLGRHVAEITNVTIGSVCWLALTASLVIYVHRLVVATRTGKRWSFRRKRVTQKNILEHSIVLIGVTTWLIQNIYIVAGRCRWFDGFNIICGAIEWSCWNAIFALFLTYAHDSNPWVRCTRMKGFRPDAIIMDAPRTYHLSKFLVFLVAEGLIIASGVLAYDGGANVAPDLRDTGCRELAYQCRITTAVTVIITLIVVIFIGYFAGVIYCFHKAYAALREKPYNSMRMANLNVRLQSRLRGLGMAFFILCVILYVYVDFGSCKSYLQSWLGFMPLYIVITGLVCVSSYLSMPNNPKTDLGVLTVWLQEFAWSEREVPGRRAERRSGLCGPAAECPMDTEPMFCFETSLKMLYWSMLVYRYEESNSRGVTLEGAMALYNLSEFELMWERKLDTKALMAWNHDTVVLSFRGTASFRNVLADVKAWYATHPPKRGKLWNMSRPFVHQGFLRSWLASGLRTKVVDRINEIVMSLKGKGGNVRVFVTGHSLGGALATLAAYDIQAACKCLPKMALSVYTFGAPRVGNHAFAREFNERVPELWNVINDQDTVPRSGKFGFLYKRPGQRCLVNSDGDMIVRPSFVEAAVQRRATSSPAHHLLVNYQRAHIAIIKAQFTSKGLRDGMAGVLAVAEACGMQNLLKAAGVEYQDLRKLHRLGTSGIPVLPVKKLSSGKNLHLRRKSSNHFSLDFDVAKVAAAIEDVDAESGEESGEEEEDEVRADRLAAVGETPHEQQRHQRNVRRGVQELGDAPDNVHYAAAIAALNDGVRDRPSNAEARAVMASGGDMEVDDGHATHLRRRSTDANPAAAVGSAPPDSGVARGSSQPDGSVAIDMPPAEMPFATHRAAAIEGHPPGGADAEAAAGSQPSSPVSPAAERPLRRTASVMSDGSSDGEALPDADAPVHNYAGKMVGGRCKYTALNGVKCKYRIADAQRRKHVEGGFCMLKDRPKEADVVEGADQGRFSRVTDGPMCIQTKTKALMHDTVHRLLGR